MITQATTDKINTQDDHFFVGQEKNLIDKVRVEDLFRQLAAAVAANKRDAVFDLSAQLVTARRSLSTSPDADKLPIREVAKQLTCGTRTVWRLVARGELRPPVHVGGSARWLRCDIQEYSERISKARR